MVTRLKMTKFSTSKLGIRDILDIGPESFSEINPQDEEDLPWTFLRRLMALNNSARNPHFKEVVENPEEDIYGDFDDEEECLNEPVHPYDILCCVLHSSDHFLQQEIIIKMATCQFAVPLLLPDGHGLGCTLMLWAMRNIVKRWSTLTLAESRRFIEKNLVEISMPVFSFVKLGKNKLSKSKILNYILSQSHQFNNFFLHEDMEGGNVQRKLSNGLVEITWYFPIGRESSDIFPEPIAVANLRGDVKSSLTQFRFLSRVSSAVFVFFENITDSDYKFLSSGEKPEETLFFVISSSGDRSVDKEKLNYLKKLNITQKNAIRRDKSSNETQIVKKLQYMINNFIKNSCKRVKLEDMSGEAIELGIKVDEVNKECQKAKQRAIEITQEIGNVVEYKGRTMKLQGPLWKELSQLEKEFCRMKKQGSKNAEEYRCYLKKRHSELYQEQHKHNLPEGMEKFLSAMTQLSCTEKQYFLKWMKFMLDSLSRDNLSSLHSKYQEEYSRGANTELKQIDQLISESSLGVEHFLRELGQFYESECSLVKEKKIKPNQRKFSKLPKIAADLLMNGFPLELVDGDASNIPLQWVTDILNELDTKTGNKWKMRVITVLGVQSTGKSTLLNTMFGLQFSVSSGRCTRGAFMTLIKVKETFQAELGCEFILVIDTEGLKAPELASLEDSYEHDNELATLVVGLSDITIINMAMENIVEMRDTMQIVAHAFLRMKETGKKPVCQFIHHNCSDVSTHEKNMRDRVKLLEQLNEMTKVAAKMERKSGVTAFSDIMTYDHEKANWYIPGLWHGVPPMASINTGYSENAYLLKARLFELLKGNTIVQRPQTIGELIIWIKSLWNAVKHEKFIFAFKNSLVAEAYDQLSIKYSGWEWNFRKKIHHWFSNAETEIKNLTDKDLKPETCTSLKAKISEIIQTEELNMLKLIENYYKQENGNVHLIERYREEFLGSVKCLRQELDNSVFNRIDEIIYFKKSKNQLQSIQSKYQKIMEDKITGLVEQCRKQKRGQGDQAMKGMFENMWKKTISGFPKSQIEKRNISQEMLGQLIKDMDHKGAVINEKLLNVKCLSDYSKKTFQMDKNYISANWNPVTILKEFFTSSSYYKIEELGASLVRRCGDYVAEKIRTQDGYDVTYCHELLNIINKRFRDEDVIDLPITHLFELDIKLVILGSASVRFQVKHNKFVEDNDPLPCLERLKPHYLANFTNTFLFETKPFQSKAKYFCDFCLKPALVEYINKHLGKAIIDHTVESGSFKEFSSKRHFQFAMLKKLLEERDFGQYLEYINRYERFVKTWIARDFIKEFCKRLNNELIISKNNIHVILFQMKEDIQQFSPALQQYLGETEKQIVANIKGTSFESVLSKVPLNPVESLLKSASGNDHKEHRASSHRPKGLAKCTWKLGGSLAISICSTDIDTDLFFSTQMEESSDYWKFILKEFNRQFADAYVAETAKLPEDWKDTTVEDALKSLEETFYMK
ncbi:hypothetical protein GDO86_019801 [Hymenochirus boettgeri]|uniref:VLIG-type G domain-containing protein n=1 Tax=Hymenochirus boettgeri TaxID=247094 RepID=A0A8T2INX5_9PIPI|nr:hypothetical protein GDO86_019801 [Hymenochirus boettgeri]